MKPFLGVINHWELLIKLILYFMNILEELHKTSKPGAILHSQNDNELRLREKNKSTLLDVHLKVVQVFSKVFKINCHFRHMVIQGRTQFVFYLPLCKSGFSLNLFSFPMR